MYILMKGDVLIMLSRACIAYHCDFHSCGNFWHLSGRYYVLGEGNVILSTS